MQAEIQPHLATQRIEEILTALWEGWGELAPEEQQQIETLYAEFRRAYEAADEWMKAVELVSFLKALDGIAGARAIAGDLIDAAKGRPMRSVVRGDPQLMGRLPPSPPTGVSTASRSLSAPPVEPSSEAPGGLSRYPNLDCPDQVTLNQRFSLTVELLIESLEPGVEAIFIEDSGAPEELPEVEVVLRARGFDIEGDNVEVMQVVRDDDSAVLFSLIPRQMGEQQIRVDFYQHGRRIGTARRNVLVVQTLGAVEVSQPAESVVIDLKSAAILPPPDLELTVELDRHDGRTLYFELHSTKEAVDYHRAKVGQVTLQGSPLEKMQAVYQEMSRMAGAAPASAEERTLAERRLAAVGRNLWDELIPDELKREYWRWKSRVRSVLITADEPWVPWEMIKPYRYHDDGEREDDAYWCQQFAISRWLSGPGAADTLPVGTARPVAPAQGDLPAVQEEMAFIDELDDLRPDFTPLARLSNRLQVLDWLENGEFSVLHFACHGLFDAAAPDNSAIALSDGPLRPSDIQARFGGRRPRPLIFINACHGARMAFSFTGLGGWADRLVKDARVGAFVGALWEVNDALAVQFARGFYTALLQGGETVAEACRRAREEIRKAAPYNSTWLAYALYADPESRVLA